MGADLMIGTFRSSARFGDGSASRYHRARRVGASSDRGRRGIAEPDRNFVRIDAKYLVGHLGEYCFVALTVRMRAYFQNNSPSPVSRATAGSMPGTSSMPHAE